MEKHPVFNRFEFGPFWSQDLKIATLSLLVTFERAKFQSCRFVCYCIRLFVHGNHFKDLHFRLKKWFSFEINIQTILNALSIIYYFFIRETYFIHELMYSHFLHPKKHWSRRLSLHFNHCALNLTPKLIAWSD